jgi:hypothetical protein
VQFIRFCLVRVPFLLPLPAGRRVRVSLEWESGKDCETGYGCQGSMENPASAISPVLESLKVIGMANKNILTDELTACAGAPHPQDQVLDRATETQGDRGFRVNGKIYEHG